MSVTREIECGTRRLAATTLRCEITTSRLFRRRAASAYVTTSGLMLDGGPQMHRRHESSNIPIELLRTAVVVADHGSYTRAARELGLSQPAISLHVKRLQKLLGGEIFDLSHGAPQLTPYGDVIVGSARNILNCNDQLLSIAKLKPQNAHQLVFGLHNAIGSPALCGLLKALTVNRSNRIVFRNLNTGHLLRGLEDGYVDIALLADPPRTPPVPVLEWWEPLHWLKGPDFRFDPAMPIPLVSWPGGLADRFGIAALKRAGLRYGIAFISSQLHSRLAAVKGGLGIMALPARSIAEHDMIADDIGLPELPRVRCGIYLRNEIEWARVEDTVGILEAQLQPRERYEIINAPPKPRKLAVVRPAKAAT
jgi:DNA-binding transcriptional LysR family regulator